MIDEQEKEELRTEASLVREEKRKPSIKKPKLLLVAWGHGDAREVKVFGNEQDAFREYAAAFANGLAPECFEAVRIELELCAKRK